MRKILAFFLALTLLLTGCAVGGEPEVPEELPQEEITAPTEDIPFQLAIYPEYSLHPVLAENRANLTLASLLYEPLFALDEHFVAQKVLCRDYTVSPDSLVWTLTLREGITFSDGTPLTAEIAAAALETARGEGSRYASRLKDISAIAGEGQTLTITLSRPNGNLPVLLDIPIALDDSLHPVGTGSYVLTGEEELQLTARTDWWQKKTLAVESIPLKSVHKSDELILSFESGDVALVDVDLMGTNSLGYSGSYETWDYPTTSMLYLGFNTRRGVCRTPQARQALALGVDRKSIAQVDYAHHAQPSALPVHPESPFYDSTCAAGLEYDPEQLHARLEELGLTGTALTLLVNSENTARVQAAQRIAQQLHWSGLEITLEKLAFEDYVQALAAGNFDLYLGEVVLTADFDLSSLLLPQAPLNYGGWADETIAQQLTLVRSAQGPQREIYTCALYDYLAAEVPIAPICFRSDCVLTRWGRLTGLNPVRGNVFYRMEEWTLF